MYEAKQPLYEVKQPLYDVKTEGGGQVCVSMPSDGRHISDDIDNSSLTNSLLPSLSLLPGISGPLRLDSQMLAEMPSDVLQLLQGQTSETRHLHA